MSSEAVGSGLTDPAEPRPVEFEPARLEPTELEPTELEATELGGTDLEATDLGGIEFNRLTTRMRGVAYRMLGSWADAEDVAAEAWLRWQRRDGEVDDLQSWLTTVATRISLDRWRTNRRRRETYIGPWLPEPVDPALLPEETVEQRESLAMGLLLVMERLTPDERAVYVLRHAFDYRYPEIATMLGRSPDSTRQLGHRARHKVAGARPRHRARQELESLRTLMAAIMEGRQADAVALLTADAVLISDGGGKVSAARRPIVGPEKIARFLIGISQKEAPSLTLLEVNDDWALLFTAGQHRWLFSAEVGPDGIDRLHSVGNPDKLRWLPGAGIDLPVPPG